MAKLSTEHRNLLHLVQIQPPSVQGIQLQRRLSMALLHWLVPKFYRKEETGKSLADDRCDVTVPESVEVNIEQQRRKLKATSMSSEARR